MAAHKTPIEIRYEHDWKRTSAHIESDVRNALRDLSRFTPTHLSGNLAPIQRGEVRMLLYIELIRKTGEPWEPQSQTTIKLEKELYLGEIAGKLESIVGMHIGQIILRVSLW